MKRLSAACLVLAPVALAVATGVDPALGEDQSFGVYRDHPDAILWHSVLLHWAWVLFVPGMLGLLSLVRDRGVVLARIAWVAIALGLTTFAALMSYDIFLLALEQTLPNDTVARVDATFMAMPLAAYGWQIPGLLGWGLSLVLAPIAAARAGILNWWTAGGALAGTALYFAFAIEPVPLCLIGPVVMAISYGFAARSLVRADRTAGTVGRGFGRISMYLAPIAFAAGMATAPDTTGNPAQSLASPTQTQVSALLLHLGWVFFIPAVWTLASGGGRVTRFAGFATVIGLAHFSALMMGDSADLAARQNLDPDTATAVFETFGSYALFNLGWALPGTALTFLGLVAVTVSAAVDRIVHWAVPALTTLGLAGFFVLGLGAVGVIGPLLLLAAFAVAARRSPPLTAPAAQPVGA
jgi:hypothetical protein